MTYQRLLHADKEPQNWLTYSGGYASNRYSLLTQINRDNVKNLQMKWVYHPIGHPEDEKMENTPLVVDGILYAGTMTEVVALDAVTGRQYWKLRAHSIQTITRRNAFTWSTRVWRLPGTRYCGRRRSIAICSPSISRPGA